VQVARPKFRYFFSVLCRWCIDCLKRANFATYFATYFATFYGKKHLKRWQIRSVNFLPHILPLFCHYFATFWVLSNWLCDNYGKGYFWTFQIIPHKTLPPFLPRFAEIRAFPTVANNCAKLCGNLPRFLPRFCHLWQRNNPNAWNFHKHHPRHRNLKT